MRNIRIMLKYYSLSEETTAAVQYAGAKKTGDKKYLINWDNTETIKTDEDLQDLCARARQNPSKYLGITIREVLYPFKTTFLQTEYHREAFSFTEYEQAQYINALNIAVYDDEVSLEEYAGLMIITKQEKQRTDNSKSN